MTDTSAAPAPKSLKRSPWYNRMRGLIGALVLIGIVVASRLHIPFSPCVFLRLDPIILACPLGTLEVTFAGHGLIWSLVPGFIAVCLLIFLLGRMWCGWVCPAHLAGHALGNACAFVAPGAARPVKKGWRGVAEKISKRVKLGKVHMLGFVLGLLVGAYIFRYPLWSIICPLGVVSRTLIQGGVHLSLRAELVFLLLPLLAMLFFRFGWKCACPVGLIYGAASIANRTVTPGLSPAPVKPCNGCGVCRAICPAGLYPAQELSTFDCTKCLRCVELCPRKSLSVRIGPGRGTGDRK